MGLIEKIAACVGVFFVCINLLNTFLSEGKYLSFCQETKNVHFSIDDTMKIFEDLTKNEINYESIFENDTLKF